MQTAQQILPLKEAIELSAKENWERDVKVGLDPGQFQDHIKDLYEDEARVVFEQFDGVSYDPDYPEHHRITVSK